MLARKGTLLIGTGILILAVAGGWVLFGGEPERAPYVGPVERIRVGNIGEFTLFNLIARDRGYFVDSGLDAAVTEYSAGPSAIADLVAGEVDVAIAADFVGANAMFRNPDVRVLAHASRHRVFSLVVRTDSGIRSPADLRGRVIGVTRGSVGEFHVGKFLEENGLSLTDVTLRDLLPAELVVGIRDGSLEAAVTFDPHTYSLRQQLGDGVSVWSVQRGRDTFATIYTTAAFAAAHPGTLERYLRALLAADDYVRRHPAESKAILARDMAYSADYVAYSWPNFEHRIALDSDLLDGLGDQGAWLIARGLVGAATMPDYRAAILAEPLRAAAPDRITIQSR